MSRVERDLGALLERGKAVRPVPSSIRARVIARVSETAKVRRSPLDSLDIAPRRRWSVRALALVAALVAGVASASLGLSLRWSAPAPQPAPSRAVSLSAPSKILPASPVVSPPVDDTEPQVVASAAPAPVSRAVRAAPTASARPSYDEELALLQRAHGAYTNGDFAGALALTAEHSRRFPGGVLAEQREALRVRSLARAGRSAESKRAAEAFASRFPRSVLLPQLRKLSGE